MSTKVAIMIPTKTGEMHCELLDALLSMVLQPIPGHEFQIMKAIGNTVIPHARSTLLSQALWWGADKLVFIDSDVSFSRDQMDLLLNLPRDIVTGSYPMRPKVQGEQELTPVAQSNLAYPTEFDDLGLAPVDKTGFGFLRVNRRVFTAMRHRFTRLRSNEPMPWDEFHRFWFPYGFSNGQESETGERSYLFNSADVAFVRNAMEHGFVTYLHKDLNVKHHDGIIAYRHT